MSRITKSAHDLIAVTPPEQLEQLLTTLAEWQVKLGQSRMFYAQALQDSGALSTAALESLNKGQPTHRSNSQQDTTFDSLFPSSTL